MNEFCGYSRIKITRFLFLSIADFMHLELATSTPIPSLSLFVVDECFRAVVETVADLCCSIACKNQQRCSWQPLCALCSNQYASLSKQSVPPRKQADFQAFASSRIKFKLLDHFAWLLTEMEGRLSVR